MKTKTIRRTVRQKWQHGSLTSFETKSFTNNKDRYHPTIDVQTGESHCDCPASVYRPTLVCKHRIRAGLNLIRKGELDPAWLHRAGKKCCHACGTENGLFGMCHDDGHPIDNVFTCLPCLPQMQPKSPSTQEIAANAEIDPFEEANAAIDLLEEDIRLMEAIGVGEHELEPRRAQLQQALSDLTEVEIPRGNPFTYEEMRRYLQAIVDSGAQVKPEDWEMYQLRRPTR